MRHRVFAALWAACVLLHAAPAAADGYPAYDGDKQRQMWCSRLVGGFQYPCHLLFGMFGSTPTAMAVDGSGSVKVTGGPADGASAAGTPVVVGGTSDGTATGVTRTLRVNDDGSINATTTLSGGSVTLSGTITPVPVTATNVSTTITSGGTFQAAMASNASRKACVVQNPITATETLYVYFGTTGSASLTNSLGLAPGASVGCTVGLAVFTDNVAVGASTTGHAFVANYGQ